MIVGVSMVKDEADILGRILAHMLDEGVDHLIVADNLSTDGTRQILDDYSRTAPVTVVSDHEVGHYQGRKMTNLAHQAGAIGATWIVPFDADEWWYSPFGSLKEVIGSSTADVLTAATYQHVSTPGDNLDDEPIRRMTYRVPEPKNLPKVAFRYQPECRLHEGNHDVDLPRKAREDGKLEIREFQYRSFEQMRRKVRNGKAAMDATNLHETYGAHWRRMGAMNDEELLAEWHGILDTPGLIYDPVNRRLPRFPVRTPLAAG